MSIVHHTQSTVRPENQEKIHSFWRWYREEVDKAVDERMAQFQDM
jgi:hypothetical protein